MRAGDGSASSRLYRRRPHSDICARAGGHLPRTGSCNNNTKRVYSLFLYAVGWVARVYFLFLHAVGWAARVYSLFMYAVGWAARVYSLFLHAVG
eukprot:256868-Prorocentrum_minimum.AAC.1